MDLAGRTDWLCGKDRRLAFDIVRRSFASLGWHHLYNCEVVFADLSQENFAGDETNNQFLVLVCGAVLEWAQSSGSACVGPIDISCEVTGAH